MIALGKARHLLVGRQTRCGRVASNVLTTSDLKLVDCISCRKYESAKCTKCTANALSGMALMHEYVRRVVRSPPGKGPRWARLMQIFAIGSTTAKALCQQFGFDPDTERI